MTPPAGQPLTLSLTQTSPTATGLAATTQAAVHGGSVGAEGPDQVRILEVQVWMLEVQAEVGSTDHELVTSNLLSVPPGWPAPPTSTQEPDWKPLFNMLE